MNKILIEMTDHGRGRVHLNGVEISGVVSVEFKTGVDKVNEVRIELLAQVVKVIGPADVTQSATLMEAASGTELDVSNLGSAAKEFRIV